MLEHRIIHGVYCIKETTMNFSRTDVRWITNPLSVHNDHIHLVRRLREHYRTYPNENMVWVTGDSSARGNGMMSDCPAWRKGCPDKKMTDNVTIYNDRKQYASDVFGSHYGSPGLPKLSKFTVFCQEVNDGSSSSTIWIDNVEAVDHMDAAKVGRKKCEHEWEAELNGMTVHVLGVAAGYVSILAWEDQ